MQCRTECFLCKYYGITAVPKPVVYPVWLADEGELCGYDNNCPCWSVQFKVEPSGGSPPRWNTELCDTIVNTCHMIFDYACHFGGWPYSIQIQCYALRLDFMQLHGSIQELKLTSYKLETETKLGIYNYKGPGPQCPECSEDTTKGLRIYKYHRSRWSRKFYCTAYLQ